MVLFIIIYVFYFAWMGNRLFAGTIEGVESFTNLDDSFLLIFPPFVLAYKAFEVLTTMVIT